MGKSMKIYGKIWKIWKIYGKLNGKMGLSENVGLIFPMK